MSQINGFKGFVGFSLRELNSNELNSFCINNNKNTSSSFPLINTQVNFTCDFLIRSYSSGCYYYDVATGKWSSDGLEILYDTNLQHTHCLSNHLTTFAGGLVVLPITINFEYIFSNAIFTQSLIAVFIIIIITFLYVLFSNEKVEQTPNKKRDKF